MGGASSPPSQSYLLDSSVLIPSLRGDNAITARIASVPAGYVSSIVLGELYFGAYGSPTRHEAALQDITAIMQSLTILASDATTAQVYGRIKQTLKSKELFMPDNDLRKAATAILYGITLAARDTHFDWIDELHVEQW
jgi:tRNA(fMet)-specific endonuclease VapC